MIFFLGLILMQKYPMANANEMIYVTPGNILVLEMEINNPIWIETK